jgi:prepilin signal peptidase PulO-like enzyme (type II secretory pathway)
MNKAMTCPYCDMPVQVRPMSFAVNLIAYRVTCPFCLNQCTLSVWVRFVAGVVGIASVGIAATLAILFVNTHTSLITAHQQLGIALIATGVGIVVVGGQAMSVAICSKFGFLVKPGVL